MFKKLDKYNLAMIEQPLAYDDLIDHAELQSKIATPICLDESINSPAKARKAAKIGACRFVNIKHARVGGITNSLKINQICADAGILCWIGGMGESSLGVNVGISLATLPNIGYPSDITPSGKFYRHDLCIPITDNPSPGIFRPRQTPGIGATLNMEVLEKTTLLHFAA
jgi:O-succinylbenzoate synthase